MDRKFKTTTYFANEPQLIPASAGGSIVNAIEFYNPTTIGGVANTVVAFVNGREIPVGSAFSISGNRDEADFSKYQLTFSATGGQVIVTRKIYE